MVRTEYLNGSRHAAQLVRTFGFSADAPAAARHFTPLRGNELRPAALHGLGAVDAMASRSGVEPLGAGARPSG